MILHTSYVIHYYHMKRNLSFLLMPFLAVLYSCSSSSSASNNIIDVESVIGTGKIRNASDYIKEIKYIPLETSREAMVGNIRKIFIHDKKIYVSDDKKVINIFDMDGRHLNTLNKTGRGPEEYLNLTDFTIDSKGNIFIASQNEGIIEYDTNLNFIKKRLPGKDESAGFIDILKLKEGLFSSNTFKIDFTAGAHEQRWTIYDDSLNTKFSYSSKPASAANNSNGGGMAITIRLDPYQQYLYNNTLNIYKIGNDTIFNVDFENNYLKSARYIINTGKYRYLEEMGSSIQGAPTDLKAISLDDLIEADNYIFIKFNFRGLAPESFEQDGDYAILNGERINMGGEKNTDVYAVYNKRNGKLEILNQPIPKKFGLKDDITKGEVFWPKFVTKDQKLLSSHNAFDLVILAEEGKIDRSVIGNLKEDDNPVIVIATL